MPQYSYLRWLGPEVDARMRAGAVRGLKKAAEHLLTEARKEVPLEHGTLERSGTASVEPESLTAAISFDTPYAVVQHEDLTLRHVNGRKAKYLEDPMARERGTVGDIIRAEIRRSL
jgi:hypothetical protein